MMIRTSFAIAAVAAGVALASLSARAQDYFVDGRAASVAEARYLASQGMAPGNWRINGWGIGPADSGTIKKIASADVSTGECWYVLDVPLGDCGAAGKAIAERAPDSGSSPQSAPMSNSRPSRCAGTEPSQKINVIARSEATKQFRSRGVRQLGPRLLRRGAPSLARPMRICAQRFRRGSRGTGIGGGGSSIGTGASGSGSSGGWPGGFGGSDIIAPALRPAPTERAFPPPAAAPRARGSAPPTARCPAAARTAAASGR